MTIELHGNFDLEEGKAVAEFARAFDAFCGHLREMGFVILWSFARRMPHTGYDNTPPETACFISISFTDRERADACFAYVMADEEPLHSVHLAVHSSIVKETARFYLVETVGASGTPP